MTRFGELKGEMFRARHISLRTLPEARLGVDGAAETIGAFDGAGGCRTECCTRRSAWHSPTRLAAPTCSSLIHWSSQGECTGCRRSSRLLDTLFVLEGDGTCCFLAKTATTTQCRSQSATQYRSQPADNDDHAVPESVSYYGDYAVPESSSQFATQCRSSAVPESVCGLSEPFSHYFCRGRDAMYLLQEDQTPASVDPS